MELIARSDLAPSLLKEQLAELGKRKDPSSFMSLTDPRSMSDVNRREAAESFGAPEQLRATLRMFDTMFGSFRFMEQQKLVVMRMVINAIREDQQARVIGHTTWEEYNVCETQEVLATVEQERQDAEDDAWHGWCSFWDDGALSD